MTDQRGVSRITGGSIDIIVDPAVVERVTYVTVHGRHGNADNGEGMQYFFLVAENPNHLIEVIGDERANGIGVRHSPNLIHNPFELVFLVKALSEAGLYLSHASLCFPEGGSPPKAVNDVTIPLGHGDLYRETNKGSPDL